MTRSIHRQVYNPVGVAKHIMYTRIGFAMLHSVQDIMQRPVSFTHLVWHRTQSGSIHVAPYLSPRSPLHAIYRDVS